MSIREIIERKRIIKKKIYDIEEEKYRLECMKFVDNYNYDKMIEDLSSEISHSIYNDDFPKSNTINSSYIRCNILSKEFEEKNKGISFNCYHHPDTFIYKISAKINDNEK